MTSLVPLAKLHGLGNDFLVHVTADTRAPGAPLDGDFARRVCDRRRGVGADGLLTATPGTSATDWTMALFNADGSRAEMSGNGIRCFAHAVTRARGLDLPGTVVVHTDAGDRCVTVEPGPAGAVDEVAATVTMGPPRPGSAVPESGPSGHRRIGRTGSWDLGNPHLVLEVDDADTVDPAEEGPAWEALFDGGMNVHFVTVRDRGRLALRTWERGAGATLACGTGATAAVLSAREWGATDAEVTVAMPGGEVRVRLDPEPVLSGPSVWIADVAVRP